MSVSVRALVTVAVAALIVILAVLFGLPEPVTFVLAVIALGCVGGVLYLDRR
ncbi:hypothetical protein [Nocardiopsis alba]|uniref:hypothetical protein n=1 Tax=Nocardiopsis alba TaxID=53437 RepID=UPI00362F9C9C